MSANSYEIHNFNNQELPILFHIGGRGCTPNWHENLEFLHCLAGRGLLVCAGAEYEMQPGHIYVINSNELHSIFDLGELVYDCLIVDMHFLLQNSLPMETLELETDIYCPEASEILQNIAIQTQDTKPYAATTVRALCLLLMVKLFSNFGRTEEENERYHNADDAIKQVIAFIHRNCDHKLTLDELAAEAGFSKYYFTRRFKKTTGMSVVAYINLIRCHKAEKLLLQNQLSVLEVANRCGFENASYFSKTFCSIMGVHPSQVKQKE